MRYSLIIYCHLGFGPDSLVSAVEFDDGTLYVDEPILVMKSRGTGVKQKNFAILFP